MKSLAQPSLRVSVDLFNAAAVPVCRCVPCTLQYGACSQLLLIHHGSPRWQLPSSPITLIRHTVCWWHAQTLIIFITIIHKLWLHSVQSCEVIGEQMLEVSLRSGHVLMLVLSGNTCSERKIWQFQIKHDFFFSLVIFLPLRPLSHLLFTFTNPYSLWASYTVAWSVT